MDLKLEDHFKNTWLNCGYTQAVNFLLKTDRGSVPSSSVLVMLVEFVLDNRKEHRDVFKQNETQNCSWSSIYETLNKQVLDFILECLLKFPPVHSNNISYFSQVFCSENLRLIDRMYVLFIILIGSN